MGKEINKKKVGGTYKGEKQMGVIKNEWVKQYKKRIK